MKYSGESNLKTIGLEMGGKSPFIVLEDAKITDDLIDNAINSAFWNGGTELFCKYEANNS